MKHPVIGLLALSWTCGCAPAATPCEPVDGASGPGLFSGETHDFQVGPLKLRRTTIDASACGPAWISIADIDNDDGYELMVSKLGVIGSGQVGPGEVTIYDRDGDTGQWNRSPLVSTSEGLLLPQTAEIADLDDDGDLDAIIPSGFFVCGFIPWLAPCGGISWMEQREDRWVRHPIVPPVTSHFYHSAIRVDLNRDGILDLVSVAEEWAGKEGEGYAALQWFAGTGTATPFRPIPITMAEGLGSILSMADIDGDSDMDFASAEYFHQKGASFVWVEQVQAPKDENDPGVWQRHIIDDQSGPSIDFMLIPNLLGDGRLAAIGTNHTNTTEDSTDPTSGVFLFEIPDDPTLPWIKTQISSGIVSVPGRGAGAPGIAGHGDLDGDGDIDLMVSGDGDPRVFLFLQEENKRFTQLTLEPFLSQAGGMKMIDFDQDGQQDFFITGYDERVIYHYEVQSTL